MRSVNRFSTANSLPCIWLQTRPQTFAANLCSHEGEKKAESNFLLLFFFLVKEESLLFRLVDVVYAQYDHY